jgi:sensor histidine kinase YesM
VISSIDTFYFSIISAMLLLSVLGMWLAAVVPGIERWSRRFFLSYFVVFVLCCVVSLVDMLMSYYSSPGVVYYGVLFLESLVLSLPLPMLTVYLLHCCGERLCLGSLPRSRLLSAVIGLWVVYLAVLVSALFVDGFAYVMSDNLYARGPLYTILILPLVAIMLLNLLGTLRRKDRLSPMVYRSFLIAILPMTGSLIVLLFVEVYPLLDVSFVLSAMAMFGLILSDQIDQNLTHQREIAEQQREIANQHASIMVLQMRPHFIYNTLMSIYSLCNQDPQKARQVTKDFTDYLRRNFKAVAGEDAIPFSAELEHTRAYLAVEQAQHEEMLLVDYDVRFTRFRLPPLTLQPIVENAVKHGMDPYAGPLHVTVRTYRVDRAGGAGSTGGASVIVVEDNGPGFDTAGLNESHEAMTNIRQRLELMCDGKMEVASRETGGTTVTVTIPDRNAEE